jgi:DnaA family protein
MRLLGAAALEGQSAADLVCCDDLDAVVADADFCEALFAIWREMEERGASLMFAMREVPPLERWALADIGSRIRGIADQLPLQHLDEVGQGQVLTNRAKALGLDLPAETLHYLLRRIPRDLELQMVLLDELDQAALTAQRRLTVPFVREVLEQRPPRLA